MKVPMAFRDLSLKGNKGLLLIAAVAVFLFLTAAGYCWPNSALAKIIDYYSNVSSLVIVLLTLAYVTTTNRQLAAMQQQLNVMDSSVKLQIQPLPVPSLENIRLEKIRAYRGPRSAFMKVSILSRFHFSMDLKNAGTGAVLNLSAFASILLNKAGEKEKETVIPQLGLEQIHLICEGDSQTLSFMILDNDFDIFNALRKDSAYVWGKNGGQVILRLRLYYRNIFGSGFLEEAHYSLSFDHNDERVESWAKFVDSGIKELETDIVRFESLIPKLPKEADASWNRIQGHLEEKFDKDLKLRSWIKPNSYHVRIVSFEESLKAEELYHKSLEDLYESGHNNN